MWVFDATPLIYLAKADQLSLVQHLDDLCAIPERVYNEVVEAGLEGDYPDARRIERCIDNDHLEVVTVSESPLLARLEANEKLSDADAAVLAHAAATDSIAVMDEAYGRDVATTEEIQTRGTAFLVLLLVKQGALEADEARDTIDAMLEAGWYCSPALYAKITRKLETLADCPGS